MLGYFYGYSIQCNGLVQVEVLRHGTVGFSPPDCWPWNQSCSTHSQQFYAPLGGGSITTSLETIATSQFL